MTDILDIVISSQNTQNISMFRWKKDRGELTVVGVPERATLNPSVNVTWCIFSNMNYVQRQNNHIYEESSLDKPISYICDLRSSQQYCFWFKSSECVIWCAVIDIAENCRLQCLLLQHDGTINHKNARNYLPVTSQKNWMISSHSIQCTETDTVPTVMCNIPFPASTPWYA